MKTKTKTYTVTAYGVREMIKALKAWNPSKNYATNYTDNNGIP